jgi:hypothetical protein
VALLAKLERLCGELHPPPGTIEIVVREQGPRAIDGVGAQTASCDALEEQRPLEVGCGLVGGRLCWRI